MNMFTAWSRLSFIARMVINAGFVLLFSGAILLYVSTRHEAVYVHDQMAEQLEREADSLLVTLSEPVIVGDYATIEQILAAHLKRDQVSAITWVDTKGHSLSQEGAIDSTYVPKWFADWMDLPILQQEQPLVVGGRRYGHVIIKSTPQKLLERLWGNFLVHISILMMAIILDFIGIMLIIKRGLRPLDSLINGANQIGAGRLTTRIPLHGSPELRRMISAFNQMAEQVQMQSERLTAIFEAASDFAIIAVNMEGIITLFNSGAEKMLGYSSQEQEGQRSFNSLFSAKEIDYLPDNKEEEIKNLILLVTGFGHDRDWQLLRKDGSEFLATIIVTELRDATGGINGHLMVAQDVTELRSAERQLRIAATAFETEEGMMVLDANGTILRVNRAFTAMTGYTQGESIGHTAAIVKSRRHDKSFYESIRATLSTEYQWRGEIWSRRKSGENFPAWLSLSAVLTSEGVASHYVASLSDLSQRKQAEEHIQYLAFYDPLTQLPNRRLLLDRLKQAIAASNRSGRWGALLFIDLDHFKNLNDSKGHDAGDQLLVEISKRIQTRLREEDTLARLGGDEFVVILGHLHEERPSAAALAEQIAEEVGAAIGRVCHLSEFDHYLTASIGAALFQDDSSSASEILKRADIAMYQAKSAGRNTIRFFDPDMQTILDARLTMGNELRKAVADNQLELYYQIQVDHNGHPVGAEALLRWNHPERGLITPESFIPLAEDSGLIVPIGQWVLENACAQLRVWERDPVLSHIQLAVNVSARQFRHADFVEQVIAVIEHFSIKPSLLKLELTETVVLDDIEDSILKMRRLKAYGLNFSLDDFGTGHSSLAYLKQLPLDQMKIDRSFVRDISIDPNDAVIVKTIIAMGRSMGMEVIAEGVETPEQRLYLESEGCYVYQGYLFGRPLPVEQFVERLLNEATAEEI